MGSKDSIALLLRTFTSCHTVVAGEISMHLAVEVHYMFQSLFYIILHRICIGRCLMLTIVCCMIPEHFGAQTYRTLGLGRRHTKDSCMLNNPQKSIQKMRTILHENPIVSASFVVRVFAYKSGESNVRFKV
jgi:hypothetical protein